jgi:hypothetical protein
MKKNIFPIEELEARKKELTAKQWAEDYLNSEEGKAETARINQETLDYMLYGKPTRYLNEQLLGEMKDYIIKTEELSADEIVEKYKGLLSDKEIKHLKLSI